MPTNAAVLGGSGFGWAGANGGGALISSVEFSATLNGFGQASIAVADADAKRLVSVFFEGDPGTQTNLFRVDPANTTHLVIEAGDGGADSNGKTIRGFYV